MADQVEFESGSVRFELGDMARTTDRECARVHPLQFPDHFTNTQELTETPLLLSFLPPATPPADSPTHLPAPDSRTLFHPPPGRPQSSVVRDETP
jgi:hypothetical protein